jgi:hypothetical protein
MKNNIFSKAAFFVIATLLFAQTSFAIGVSPPRTELTLAPGESQDVTIKLLNQDDFDIQAVAEIEAFLKNDEQGFPIPIEMAESDVHNIANWIILPEEPVFVPANGSTAVTFTVAVPEGAEPGGKYASILYSPMPKEDEGDIKIRTRVASLVLINVEGDTVVEGNIESFGLPDMINGDEAFYLPVTFVNTGNTHVKPMGWIELINKETGESLKGVATYKDEAGNEVVSDKIPVNQFGGNVLPDSKRTFKCEWTNNVKSGDYTAKLTLSYADQPEITRSFDFSLKEDLEVTSFDFNAGMDTTSFILTVKNNGNVYEKLNGSIDITNNFGYKVDSIAIPEDIEYVAPGESKTFTFEWVKGEAPEGRYTAELSTKLGVTNMDFVAKVTFGEADYTNMLLIGGLVVLVLVLIIVIAKKKKRA